jgi:hypothetical protein
VTRVNVSLEPEYVLLIELERSDELANIELSDRKVGDMHRNGPPEAAIVVR